MNKSILYSGRSETNLRAILHPAMQEYVQECNGFYSFRVTVDMSRF